MSSNALNMSNYNYDSKSLVYGDFPANSLPNPDFVKLKQSAFQEEGNHSSKFQLIKCSRFGGISGETHTHTV